MRKIRATAEIKALKTVIYERTMEVVILRNENEELRKQLEESRAKEGKGALEKMIDGIADAVSGIGKIVSTMSPDELKALIEAKDCDDCDDDCDCDDCPLFDNCPFDCELKKEDDTNGQ